MPSPVDKLLQGSFRTILTVRAEEESLRIADAGIPNGIKSIAGKNLGLLSFQPLSPRSDAFAFSETGRSGGLEGT
jgi:hypothetical protein